MDYLLNLLDSPYQLRYTPEKLICLPKLDFPETFVNSLLDRPGLGQVHNRFLDCSTAIVHFLKSGFR